MRAAEPIVRLITGHRTKWLVLLAWVAVGVVSFSPAAKLNSATTNDQRSSLPAGSASAKALDLQRRLPGSDTLPAVIVFQRAAGLTAQDRALILADAARIKALSLPSVQGVFPGPMSADGKAAYLTVPIKAANDITSLTSQTRAISKAVGTGAGGLQVRLTGPAGFTADTTSVFSNINTKLLIATVAIVAILLLITYRSPFLWLLPLLSVGLFADLPSRALAYLLATKAGVKIDAEVAGITVVLVFGAGTDYALLLIARYREELRRQNDKHQAMARALRQAGPAILASGLTVTLALLTLLFASLNSNRGLGPLAAISILLTMIAMLTALPALLLVFPRRIFWPQVPRCGSVPREEAGVWARMGGRLFGDAAGRPRTVAIATGGVLALMALGLFALDTNLSQANFFRGHVQSVEGQQLLQQSYPSGVTAPTTVIVPGAKLPAALAVAKATAGVAEVAAQPPLSAGSLASFQVVLASDPYGARAWATVGRLRTAMIAAAGPQAVVGGASAQSLDVHRAAVRDTLVVAPLVLLVVLVILAILLRSLVAPVMLIGTVILSFAAALGASVLVFHYLFGYAAMDAGTPLLAFVFLAALGVDYNIFLMARVREETQSIGTRKGTLKALAVTGGVITSAGLVLVGTFSVLSVLPLVVLIEFGFVVAFGVLLDTFVVRTVLVPALTLWIGPRVWWPSSTAAGDADDGPADSAPPVPPAPLAREA